MSRNACSGTTRLSKGALLSMMGDAPFRPSPMTEAPMAEEKKERILSVIDSNGGNLNRASIVLGIAASSLRRRLAAWSEPKTTREEQSTSPTRRFFERTKSPWSIRSFDPRSREVCIEVRNPVATTNFGFRVPYLRIPD